MVDWGPLGQGERPNQVLPDVGGPGPEDQGGRVGGPSIWGLPAPVGRTEASIALTPHPTSSYAARNFVGGTLRRWNREDLAEVAVLLTSEVVTNVIVHARTDLVITMRLDAGRLRVAVGDEVIAPPRLREPDADGGRGLALVEALAGSWGVFKNGAGKAVWFEV